MSTVVSRAQLNISEADRYYSEYRLFIIGFIKTALERLQKSPR